jgi:hypothetical protein
MVAFVISSVSSFRLRLIVWWLNYRRRRPVHFTPLLRGEFSEGDFYSQAQFLCECGYYNAATVIARLAVEKEIHKIVLLHEDFRIYRQAGLTPMIQCLAFQNLIDQSIHNRLSKWAHKVNRSAHRTVLSRHIAFGLVGEAHELRHHLMHARRRALSRSPSAAALGRSCQADHAVC